MLDSVLGPGKATVRVSAADELGPDRADQRDLLAGRPDRRRRCSPATPSPRRPTAVPAAAAGGVPGAASNNGAVPTYQGGAPARGGTTKTDIDTTYQLNKSVQKVVRAPGAVTRLSVSVMLDDDPNNPNPALRQSVQDAVNAAAGIDPTRGDVLDRDVAGLQPRPSSWRPRRPWPTPPRRSSSCPTCTSAALVLGPLLMLVVLFFILEPRPQEDASPKPLAVEPRSRRRSAAKSPSRSRRHRRRAADRPSARQASRQRPAHRRRPAEGLHPRTDPDARQIQPSHRRPAHPDLDGRGSQELTMPQLIGHKSLKGRQKAAALLIAMGAEVSSEVLKHFKETEIETLTFEIFQLEKLSEETKGQVLEECYHMAVARDFITSGGADYARDMLAARPGQGQGRRRSSTAWRRRAARSASASPATRIRRSWRSSSAASTRRRSP